MAVVNAYTRLTPSTFDPMSMQEIFTVPLARQKMHDEAQGQLDELGLFDINRLSQDDATAKAYIDDYRNRINQQTEEIMSKGVDNRAVRNVRGLLSDKQKWLSNDGVGGKIVGNYNAYKQYKTTLDELLKKGEIGNTRYQALLNQATNNYEGVEGDGQLNLEAAANRVDVGEKLKGYAKDMMANPRVLETNTGFKFDPSTGMFINQHTRQELHPKQMINQVLRNMAYTDPEITNYLGQRERLGLGGMDATIQGITQSLDAGYSVNNIERSLTSKFMPEWMTGSDDQDGSNLPSFELNPAESIEIRDGNLLKNINQVLSGETVPNDLVIDYDEGYNPFTATYSRKKNPKEGEAIGITKGNQDRYNEIARALQDSKIAPEGDINSKPVMEKVSQYLASHNNVQFQSKVNTTGIYKNYEGLNLKNRQTDRKELFTNISAQLNKRLIVDPDTYEVISYDNLPEADKELFDTQKGIVTGVYDSGNFLREQVNKDSDPSSNDALASPYEVKLQNGKKYIVGRGASEINSPAYKAEAQYNQMYRRINKLVDLPQKTTIPTLGDISITKLSDGAVVINMLDSKGENTDQSFTLLNDEALKSLYLFSNGINVEK